ncbi:MAG TPA: lytic transglycosylase domain-containing protein [Terriglobia bacterium]|nr:lytic transglycosylase domain-containing protein [Terriglobia bacterium]
MSDPYLVQLALLIFVLTLAARVLPAQVLAQTRIALVADDRGRVVYINADDRSLFPAPSGTRSRVAPEAIRQVIGSTAGRFNLDPRLVDAVVRVESGYDVRAQSPKGAQGLMQLIPATAARFGVHDPFDPAENVRGGVTYLSRLLTQFKGDVPLTLAAYNAGEGAVARYGGVPPYAETRDYVRKVTRIYGDAGPALTPDNASRIAPIYQYVDERGVTHFAQ